MYILYIYIYVYRVHIRISCIYTCTWRNITHHFRCNTKHANHEFFTIIFFGNQKRTREKNPKPFWNPPSASNAPGVLGKSFGMFRVSTANNCCILTPERKQSWTQLGFVHIAVRFWGGNKWFWNGPHAEIFSITISIPTSKWNYVRAHKMHSSGWELTHTPPHVTFK